MGNKLKMVAVVSQKNMDQSKKSMKYTDRIIKAFDGDYKNFVSATKLKSILGLTSRTQMNAFKSAIGELSTKDLIVTKRASYRLRAAAKKVNDSKVIKKPKKVNKSVNAKVTKKKNEKKASTKNLSSKATKGRG